MIFGYIFTGLFILVLGLKISYMIKDEIEDSLIDRLFDACRKRLKRKQNKK
jgi:hypothetical protein